MVLGEAAFNGHLDILKYALEHATANNFSKNARAHNTLYSAASAGRSDVVKLLLQQQGFPWDVDEAFQVAAEKGFHGIVGLLFVAYPLYARGKNLLLQMIRRGHTKSVEMIILGGYADSLWIDKAWAVAVLQNHVDIIQMLIHSGHVASKAYDEAFVTAAQRGLFRTVAFLYGNKRPPPQVVRRAFENAGNVAVHKFLLNNESISAVSITTAFRISSGSMDRRGGDAIPSNERTKIMQTLCDTECIAPRTISSVFVWAAKKGDVAVVEALHDRSCISTETINTAFSHATTLGYVDIVKLLCTNQQVSPKSVVEATVFAALKDSIPVLNISYFRAVAEGLMQAVQRGKSNVVKRLYSGKTR